MKNGITGGGERTSARARMTKHLLRGAAILSVGIAVAMAASNCGSDRPPAAGDSNFGNSTVAVGPCTNEGETRECHAVVARRENYVSCFNGQQTCQNGMWSPCMGTAGGGGSISTRAVRPTTDPSADQGMPLLSYGSSSPDAGSCQVDPCNPYCNGFDEVPPAPIGPAPGCIVGGDGGVDAGPADAGGDAGCTTTVSGVVFDPAAALPLPNVYVYQPTGALVPLPDNGATPQCDTCASLLSPNNGTVYSAVDGSFTLPVDVSGGTTNIRLVVQTGRWRREITIPSVTACGNTALANGTVRLPRNRTEGNIPKIAIGMANQESLECLLVKMGVSTSEFAPYQTATDPNRIQLFRNNGNITTTPAAPAMLANLVGNAARLNSYSAVIFPCGAGGDVTLSGTTAAQRANVSAYANAGGKVFINHVPGDAFIKDQLAATGWPATATIANAAANEPCGSPPCVAKTKLLTGVNGPDQLTAWMSLPSVGGTVTYGTPFYRVNYAKNMVTAVNATTSIEWARGLTTNNWTATPGGNYTMVYSFETPPTAANKCGRVVYSDMHLAPARGTQGMPFPAACSSAPLSEDEKAFEYLLFALTACAVGTPPVTPPPISPPPAPITVNNTYVAACPPGYVGKWNTLGYNVSTPLGTEIKVALQTSADGGTGTWTPTTGSPAGVPIADIPLDHPGGNDAGAPSCTATGPSPCGNNCASALGQPMTSACPATCDCPIDIMTPLGANASQPFLSINATLSPSAGNCLGVISPGLRTSSTGTNSGCSGGGDIGIGACTTNADCQQDFRCQAGTCKWNVPDNYIDPNCKDAMGNPGVDLTIGAPCGNGANYMIPICNRGGGVVPAGTVIQLENDGNGGHGAWNCSTTNPPTVSGGAVNCSYTLPAPLNGGACTNIDTSKPAPNGGQCSILLTGQRDIYINYLKGVTECGTGFTGTGPGCMNNSTHTKSTGSGCPVTCGAAATPPQVPSMSTWTVTFSCEPNE